MCVSLCPIKQVYGYPSSSPTNSDKLRSVLSTRCELCSFAHFLPLLMGVSVTPVKNSFCESSYSLLSSALNSLSPDGYDILLPDERYGFEQHRQQKEVKLDFLHASLMFLWGQPQSACQCLLEEKCVHLLFDFSHKWWLQGMLPGEACLGLAVRYQCPREV